MECHDPVPRQTTNVNGDTVCVNCYGILHHNEDTGQWEHYVRPRR